MLVQVIDNYKICIAKQISILLNDFLLFKKLFQEGR